MTTLLATLASIAAAAGLTDLLALRRPRRPREPLRAVAKLGAKLGVNPAGGLAQRVAAAGIDRPTSEIVALQAGLALIAALAAAPLAALAPGRLGLVLLLAAPAGGYLAPEYALRARARARGRAMEAELPDVLDLMRVAIAAGLAPRRALKEVGKRHPGTLAKELQRAADRTSMGESAEQALTQLEARCARRRHPAVRRRAANEPSDTAPHSPPRSPPRRPRRGRSERPTDPSRQRRPRRRSSSWSRSCSSPPCCCSWPPR